MNRLIARLVQRRVFQGNFDLHLVRASMIIIYFFYRQGLDEVTGRDRAGDPCATAPHPSSGYRRQRAFGTR